MKTLIELFDERPIENVLSADVFRPEKIVFLCGRDEAQNKTLHRGLKTFFEGRGIQAELVFLETSMYYADKVRRQLASIVDTCPDCAIDITGGTDAALFAAGMLYSSNALSVFTYSRARNRFFNICNADFAENLACDVVYSIEDFFAMSGGAMKEGRDNQELLNSHLQDIDPFFNLYLKHKKKWGDFIVWMQRASAAEKGEKPSLSVSSSYTVKGEHSSKIDANEQMLADVREIGFIRYLEILRGKTVSFNFADDQVRFWLRDAGSVLEVYVYKACLDAGIFNEVKCSVIVEWNNGVNQDKVSNEIDVMAVKGIIPLFISCKTCAVDTDALNELSILRDRFGGKMAKAVIVTTENCRNVTRNRATALGITVIDMEDISCGNLAGQLREIME